MRTAGYKRVQLLLQQDDRMSGDRARNGSFSGGWGYEPDLRDIGHGSREDLNTKGKTRLSQRCCVNEIP